MIIIGKEVNYWQTFLAILGKKQFIAKRFIFVVVILEKKTSFITCDNGKKVIDC